MSAGQGATVSVELLCTSLWSCQSSATAICLSSSASTDPTISSQNIRPSGFCCGWPDRRSGTEWQMNCELTLVIGLKYLWRLSSLPLTSVFSALEAFAVMRYINWWLTLTLWTTRKWHRMDSYTRHTNWFSFEWPWTTLSHLAIF